MSFESVDKIVKNKLHILIEVARLLTASAELPIVLPESLAAIVRAFKLAEFGALFLWHPATSRLRGQVACGQSLQDAGALRRMVLRNGESALGKTYALAEVQLLSTAKETAAALDSLEQDNRICLSQAFGAGILPRSMIMAPLIVGEQKQGILWLGTLSGSPTFSEADVSFVQTLANLLALALGRSRPGVALISPDEAQESEHLRAEMLAVLSHELSTPLAAMKGYLTALLLEEVEWPGEKRREFLHHINEEVDNLQTMIREILDTARFEVGLLEIEAQPVRLPRLAQEVTDEMQQRTSAHRFVLDFPRSFPLIDADPRRIRQVLRNVLDNAVKYSPEGGLIVIRSEVRPDDVVVSIADQGIGISPEDMIPLFDKYFRAKSPTGHRVPGTGLGLPVSRAIIEAHGGRIWAESRVGEGTTIHFSLPREGLSADIETRANDG